MIALSQLDTNEQPPTWADTPVLLRAEGLQKAFGGQVVLDGVNVELKRGEVVLLRGENGSGKTTLLNILTGNLEPDAGEIHYLADGTPRTYRFPRHWWQELNPFDHFVPEFVAREGIGRTWQDVRLFGSQTLRENITVAEPGHPGENPIMALIAPGRSVLIENKLRDQADIALARFGLAGREESSADKISLGQSKRVAIARAVAAGAKVLFLDEPLAGLDSQGIADVLGLLESLVREHTLTLVIVEHVFNQSHLHGLVTTDWQLVNGQLILSDRFSVNQEEPTSSSRPPWFNILSGEGAIIIDEPLPRDALLTRIRRPDHFCAQAKPTLEICGLVVRRGNRTVIGLDDQGNCVGFNLILYEGEIAILQAPNGWGKSTLFAAVCGALDIDDGEIYLRGKRLNGIQSWERIKNGLRALPANRQTFPSLSAREAVSLSQNNIPAIDLGHLAGRACSSLSGGEMRRVAILAMKPGEVHVLDEPFSALDCRTHELVAAHLCKPSTLILQPMTHRPSNTTSRRNIA